MPLDDCRNFGFKITDQSPFELTTVVATAVNFLSRSKHYAVVARYIKAHQRLRPHRGADCL